MVAGQRAPALRFLDPRVLALFGALVLFRLLPEGFTARDLRQHVAPLLGLPPDALSAGRVTYNLRRLRLHGVIERAPHRHRYRVTDAGLRLALSVPRLWARTLRPGLATVMPDVAPTDGPLRRAFERLEHAMDDWCAQGKLVARNLTRSPQLFSSKDSREGAGAANRSTSARAPRAGLPRSSQRLCVRGLHGQSGQLSYALPDHFTGGRN